MTELKKLDVIATLNKPLLKKEILEDFLANGATHFRINGAHVLPENIGDYVQLIRGYVGTRVKILLDLPGNKIRTADIAKPITFKAGGEFELGFKQFNYPKFCEFLKVGDTLLANDSRYHFTVKNILKDTLLLVSKTEGTLIGNKGVHLTRPHPELPILFERDLALIQAAQKSGVDYLGVSFVRTPEDVHAVRRAAGDKLKLIVKVETAKAVKNLAAVLDTNDEFLVDRGDLSCDVGLEKIERYQKQILKHAQAKNKKVFFATQFLITMLDTITPTIPEVSALTDAINSGVDGIQFSEETAIGKYPMEVLEFVQKVRQYSRPLLKFSEKGRAPTIWFTGRSGAGKSTITKVLKQQIEDFGYTVCFIDGDEYREFFSGVLGYTEQDRQLIQRNIVFTAHQASRSFDMVIVSSLSPYEKLRAFAREKLVNFYEVYVDCSLEVCAGRDPKGHYKNAKEGKLKNFVASPDMYEVPKNPELILNTEKSSLEDCVAQVLRYLFRE